MDNFDLRKYLAENILLKEVSINGKPVNVGSLTVDYNMGPGNRIDKNEKYFYSGEYEDGEEIGDEDLDDLAYDNPELLRSIFENKLLKEDEQPTHRIKTDVYYIKDYEDGRPGGMEFQDEAVPAYEIADPEEEYFDSVMDDVLRYDDGNFLYIDEGEEGWYDGDYFETVGGSNTRLLPDYLEVIKEPDQQGGYGYNL